MDRPRVVIANFVDPIYSIGSNPYGLEVIVDNVTHQYGDNEVWAINSLHTLSTRAFQEVPGDNTHTIYQFSYWSASNGQSSRLISANLTTTVTANTTDSQYFANFVPRSGNCYTYTFGGAQDGNGIGVTATRPPASVARVDGNHVRLHAELDISGSNAGIVRANVQMFYYYNTVLISSPTYSNVGGAAGGDINATLYSNSQYNLGPFQLGSPTGHLNHYWFDSPICTAMGYAGPNEGNNLDDYSSIYTAVKPTITGPGGSTSAAIWYLGGEPSIDGFYVQTTLTGNTNWSSTNAPYWSVLQGSRLPGFTKVSLSASVASTNTVTSTGANASSQSFQYDYDVLVQISTDGLPSDPFPISVNAPWRVYPILVTPDSNSGQGFESDYIYGLYDVAGNVFHIPITLHETEENCQALYQGANWCDYAATGGTWFAVNPGTGTTDWNTSTDPPFWVDGYKFPAISQSPPSQNPQSPLLTTPVESLTQKFFVGALGSIQFGLQPGTPWGLPFHNAPNVFRGICVERNIIEVYLDHARDQIDGDPSSAPITPASTDPVSSQAPAPLCKSGALAN
jgi:hypothetical protein